MRRAIGTCLILVASAAFAAGPEPAVRVELRKTEDAATVTAAGGATVISVTSVSGIGGAKLVRTGAAWPAKLTIRLKLASLESFAMSNGIIQFHAKLGSPGRMPYWKVGPDGEQAETPAGSVDVPLTQAGNTIEIIVPREILDRHAREIDFGWIDAYRE